ncbi:cation-dependent mannose-6-phosphate receptor [Leptinotarsa decemlineata]|uniref:cation-dependent mannose-6-phosphate receptor n=1 Tax=Leptinotarsa decemlineata TaxID=7539 RepID=UPI003D307198
MNDSKIIVILLYTLSFSFFFETCYSDICINENPCLCQITEYTKIDISKLLGDEKYLEDSSYESGTAVTYRFSGCKNFSYNVTVGNKIQEDSASLIQINGMNTTKLGIAKNIHFNLDSDEGYQIIYRNGSESDVIATVNLVCVQFKETFFKVISDKSKDFLVGSPKVCVITEHQGLSGGSVFLIILIVLATVYFIGGALISYFIRGARGVEIVPNIDFWRNLPGLVKDGAIFLLSGCKPTLVTSSETYDRI